MTAWAAQPAPGQTDSLGRRRSPIVRVVQQVRDSIVSISSTGLVKVESRHPLDFFFDVPRARKVNNIGSGFVMHEAGYLVTNAHVVDRAIDLRATFANGDEYQASVVVSDTTHDLAILRIRPRKKLQPIPMGRSDDLMPGETVIAIGNPLGYANTVTTGIISALSRRIEFSPDTAYEDLIQTDASINPGSSGGPLLNVLGELIGVNTAIRADAQNIGFAIPVDRLRALLPDMFDYAIAEGRHFQLGMRVEGSAEPRVVEVIGDSPAAKAGVHIGDQLLQVNGQPVRRDVDFYISMLGRSVGDRVALRLDRQGKARDVQLTLSELPKPDGAALAVEKFGMVVEALSPRVARLFGVKPGAGVLIVGVDSRSPADRAGCRPGDLLVRIGRHRLSDPDDLGTLLEGVESGTPADLTLWRIIRNEVYEIPRVRVYAR
ncbi:MAG: trypsin-like peptidase domain-containing protein [Phycisphaerae bacterium]